MKNTFGILLILGLLAGCATQPAVPPSAKQPAPGPSSVPGPPANPAGGEKVSARGLVCGNLALGSGEYTPVSFTLVSDSGARKAGIFFPKGSYCIPGLEPGRYQLTGLNFRDNGGTIRTLDLDQAQISYLAFEISPPSRSSVGEVINLKQLKVEDLRTVGDKGWGTVTFVPGYNEFNTVKEILGATRKGPWVEVLMPMRDLAEKFADR